MHLWNLLLLLFNLNCLHAMALRCYVTLWQSPALDARVVLVHVHMQAQTAKQTHTQTHPARERLTNTFKLSSSAMHSDNNNSNNWRRSFAAGGHLACEPSCISLENRINVYQVHTHTSVHVYAHTSLC